MVRLLICGASSALVLLAVATNTEKRVKPATRVFLDMMAMCGDEQNRRDLIPDEYYYKYMGSDSRKDVKINFTLLSNSVGLAPFCGDSIAVFI
jgi:hypothetical protein